MSTYAITFSDHEKQMIARMYSDAPKDEVERFMHTAQTLGMHPLFRQIYLLPRWSEDARANKYLTVCGIDGYRAAAERTGLRAGYEDPVVTKDETGKIVAVTVVLLKRLESGVIDRYPATAYFSEFAAYKSGGRNLTRFWAEKPILMTTKCAEALAYRMAYPFLSGTYTMEELDRTLNQDGASDNEKKPQPSTEVLQMDDAQVRKAFGELVAGRTEAALRVFKSILPESQKLEEISLQNLRIIISLPYRERYDRNLRITQGVVEKNAEKAKSVTQQGATGAEEGKNEPAPKAETSSRQMPTITSETGVQPAAEKKPDATPGAPVSAPAAETPASTAPANSTPATSPVTPPASESKPAAAVKEESVSGPTPSAESAATTAKPATNVNAPTVSPEIAKLPDAEVRLAFAALIGNRKRAAFEVFAKVIPNSGRLEDIPLDKVRIILSEPFKDSYVRKLAKADQGSANRAAA